ncbi:hypothetical protein CALCODRAFT_491276 [Calocera cornea HHB12733]|uniref:Uncharacterized protein n=1 Tax=Calocera cornea HHB12733 TaxID=1353952 RepID=A0A165J751_9BASI|nr:hypothetical protein CALCODRAFT_491276 [Calocera cornea HHB12733]
MLSTDVYLHATLLALTLSSLTRATPTSPHRARQSPPSCSYYSCPSDSSNGTLSVVELAFGQLLCAYGTEEMCYYGSTSPSPLQTSSAGCLNAVCTQQSACSTTFSQCPPFTEDGFITSTLGYLPDWQGIPGNTVVCNYEGQSMSGTEEVDYQCYYAEMTGQLVAVSGGVTCPTTSLCASSSRRS